MKFKKEFVRTLPKVLLHDHLDGGVRPQTIIELAKEQKYKKLPTVDAGELADWFYRGAARGRLSLFLEGFEHTCGVMQTEEALERVAYETLEDMKKDGVVYIESRFAPVFHISKKLDPHKVVKAVLHGFERGKKDFGVHYGLIICAMRNMDPSVSLEMAELAVDFRNRGVVGFDLAGEEGGYPPKKHVDAFHYIQRENFNITVHAGEAYGKASIWQAIQWCGAHRIGHATRLIEDMRVKEGEVQSMEEHPFGILYRYKFRCTLNTDDRLMSNVTLTDEYCTAAEMFDLKFEDLEKLTINAMKSAFMPYKQRIAFIYDILKPGFAKAKEKLRKKY